MAEGPRFTQDARHAPALARLTLAQARALEGWRGLYTTEPESLPVAGGCWPTRGEKSCTDFPAQ